MPAWSYVWTARGQSKGSRAREHHNRRENEHVEHLAGAGKGNLHAVGISKQPAQASEKPARRRQRPAPPENQPAVQRLGRLHWVPPLICAQYPDKPMTRQ